MDAEDMLYILYTSGTTGKPKGIVHTTAGYLTGVYATTKWVFDLKDDDVYWCTADIGWVTGHSYVVYGPLANGATVVMYEGAPDWPKKDRLWEIVERYGVTIFYTAPTAIRAFMKWGTEWPAKHDLTSLRLMGSVGEPINPEAWIWYHLHIGNSRCPIVDTWWQTETGAIMITPLPGITRTKPGSATQAFPGISTAILTDKGQRVPVGGGLLAITKPWPSMLRTIYGDHERYVKRYWSRWGRDVYFTGDGAKLDDEGYYWLLGRVDDVLNVAGHRIGTMEVESALVDHPKVAEAAVVGRTHEIKGQALAAFVTVKEGVTLSETLADDLKKHVAQKIGAIARPDDIIFAADLTEDAVGEDHAAAAARHRRRQGARRYDDAGGSHRRRQAERSVRKFGVVTHNSGLSFATASRSRRTWRPAAIGSSRPWATSLSMPWRSVLRMAVASSSEINRGGSSMFSTRLRPRFLARWRTSSACAVSFPGSIGSPSRTRALTTATLTVTTAR